MASSERTPSDVDRIAEGWVDTLVELNPAVGKRYRDIVLGNGGQKPAPELVREFLQRDSNSKAFFEELRK